MIKKLLILTTVMVGCFSLIHPVWAESAPEFKPTYRVQGTIEFDADSYLGIIRSLMLAIARVGIIMRN